MSMKITMKVKYYILKLNNRLAMHRWCSFIELLKHDNIFQHPTHVLQFCSFPLTVQTETIRLSTGHRTETGVTSFSIFNDFYLCHNCIMFTRHLFMTLVSAFSFFHFPVIYIK